MTEPRVAFVLEEWVPANATSIRHRLVVYADGTLGVQCRVRYGLRHPPGWGTCMAPADHLIHFLA